MMKIVYSKFPILQHDYIAITSKSHKGSIYQLILLSFLLGVQEVVGRIEWSIFYSFQMIDE